MKKPKNILLGISASIAIYRCCDLVRELTKRGHSVRVVMTKTAASWIHPLVFEALSNQKVFTEQDNLHGMPHIELRTGVDLYVIVPATADTIARAAAGRADDIVTATLLSYSGLRWFVPAMNPYMFEHPATQRNLKTLQSFGYRILDPTSGEVICGDEGRGKMMAVTDIITAIESI